MKPIPSHTNSIEIEFTTKGFLILRTTIPLKLNPVFKISDWYRKTKEALANTYGLPISNIKGRHKIIQSKFYERILFEWPRGILLDVPDTCSAYDCKIILHYLEGLKMAISRK